MWWEGVGEGWVCGEMEKYTGTRWALIPSEDRGVVSV